MKVLRRLTIVRKNDGTLGLFVGSEEIHGLASIEIHDNAEGSYTKMYFANKNLHFDTEEEPEKETAN